MAESVPDADAMRVSAPQTPPDGAARRRGASGGSGVGSGAGERRVGPLPRKFLEHIRLVVWDFDYTVLSIHSYAEGIEPDEVDERRMEDDFTDLAFFQELVRELVGQGVQVAVASFGRYEVIQRFLNRAFPEGLFTRENISTPGSVGSRDGYALRGGKNSQLDDLRRRYGDLKRHEIVFFDGADPPVG